MFPASTVFTRVFVVLVTLTLYGWIGAISAFLFFPILHGIDRLFYSLKPENSVKDSLRSRLRPYPPPFHPELYHNFIDIGERRFIHYASIGIPDGRPLLLFLHGFLEVRLAVVIRDPVLMIHSVGIVGDIKCKNFGRITWWWRST